MPIRGSASHFSAIFGSFFPFLLRSWEEQGGLEQVSIDQQLQLAAYLEHGGIWINKDSSLNPGAKNHRNLQGIGLGLIWSRHEDWFVRADYAWKLGSEEPVSDTRHSNGQFWLRTGVYF